MNKENVSKKLIRSKSGLRIVAVDDNQKSPFLLCEPQWIPDKEAPVCTKCGIKFGFTTRRHHCRRCGHIYCNSCCDHKLELRRMCFIDPVRICENCIPVTLEENKFFDQQIKILTNGATFILSCIVENSQMVLSTSSDVLLCKLSADHRYLVFDGVKISPIDISLIKSLNVDKDVIAYLDEDKDMCLKSVEIEYSLEKSREVCSVKLDCTPELEHRKTGSSWIVAMEQAIKMLQEYQLDG